MKLAGPEAIKVRAGWCWAGRPPVPGPRGPSVGAAVRRCSVRARREGSVGAGGSELHTCRPRRGGGGAGLLERGEVSQRGAVRAAGLAGGARRLALRGGVSWSGCLVGATGGVGVEAGSEGTVLEAGTTSDRGGGRGGGEEGQ